MTGSPLHGLQLLHGRLLDLGTKHNEEALRTQYHSDLSPLGWHLAHVAFIEQYWLREVILQDESKTMGLHTLYFPELNDKEGRSDLDGIADLAAIRATYAESEELLGRLMSGDVRHPLLEQDYIAWFLLQHAEQHFETMQMIVHQKACSDFVENFTAGAVVMPVDPVQPDTMIEGGIFTAGSDAVYSCDNEQPAHRKRVEPFALASFPVTNAEYQGFIESAGYQEKRYWCDDGWQWKEKLGAVAPEHWRKDAAGNGYRVSPRGAADIEPAAAVTGLSWYEASAFARYAGCRLPHELEWEYAMRADGMDASNSLWASTGHAWEWCANAFYPYDGFEPFPYERYSTPWFDGRHFTLRGSSPYTGETVRHPAFRNFYEADKRHIFSGLRLVADL